MFLNLPWRDADLTNVERRWLDGTKVE